MKIIYAFTILFALSNKISSQTVFVDNNIKRPITTDVYKKWPSVSNPLISDNGKYVAYTISSPSGIDTLVIKSTKNHWEKKILGGYNGKFTTDNKRIVFLKRNDTLCLFKLETGNIEYINNVNNFKLVGEGKEQNLIYLKKDTARHLVIKNVTTDKKKCIEGVNNFSISVNGSNLVFVTNKKMNDKFSQVICWLNLINEKTDTIWSSESEFNFKFSDFQFDIRSEQIAFIAQIKDDINQENELWYYRHGMNYAQLGIKNKNLNFSGNFQIAFKVPTFSNDGKRIFFTLKEEKKTEDSGGEVDLDIWSYSDKRISKHQDEMPGYSNKQTFAAVYNISNRNIYKLENRFETIVSSLEKSNSEFVLIEKRQGSETESNWNPISYSSIFLQSTIDGTKKLIQNEIKQSWAYYKLSPFGKFIVYYDTKAKHFFSFDIKSGIRRNITKDVVTSFSDEDYDLPGEPPPIGIAAWLENDAAVLIYDNYDIWKVHLSANSPPVCITNEYGRKNRIKFRLGINEGLIVSEDKGIILLAFNNINKDNGFYRLNSIKGVNPEKLSMGPYVYSWRDISIFNPIKAKKANVYIINRMSVSSSPNFYLTNDFKHFKPVSNVYPENAYNWFNSHLVKWRSFIGDSLEGILYTPFNFDSTKKYPIIFSFYERMSHELNKYIKPEESTGPINIAYFVSNEYLVFAPDIHFKVGKLGESIYNAVVSAAKYLGAKPWVDSSKMGIHGHSFGGFAVNYLITQTNIFSAGASAAGLSDLISFYGTTVYWGSAQYLFETGQTRLGYTLWDNPSLYIDNSPVLKADKVSTPLLMMNNKLDPMVSFSQGVEYFLALRRLRKKVWLLKYNQGFHEVNGKDAEDYNLRLIEFFNHFLKMSPIPKWMEEKNNEE
ncbi:alpha/beta hydrolase family protein [Longitalea arenae]|uniref:alpha/beta hydrolase family protein n=1 Tax=Longitalea arenae TaxID=2812558 RepID=UPI00196832E8|nr:prolyl oligopeptidase family serine peptidase [Longitalea arenae]